MKRIIKVLFILTLVFNFGILNVSASTNTFTRTEDNLLINDWIDVTETTKEHILSTPAVDASEKIYDYADLFTDSEEKRLYSEVSSFIKSKNLDLAIVTINDNPKSYYNGQESHVVYADDFYDYNDFGMGSKTKDGRDGLLFLVDMDTRHVYISTTKSIMNIYTNADCDKITEDISSYFTNGDYYDGASEMISLLDKYYSEDYDSNALSMSSRILCSLLGGLVVTAIVMFILIRKNKLVRPATSARESLDKTSVAVNNNGDVFIGTNTVRHRIEHSSSSGGGGGSHSSSSGGSHGGGGHSF